MGNTLSADIELVQRSNAVMEMYGNKEIDPYTNKPVSKDTYDYAVNVASAFTGIALNKASKLNKKENPKVVSKTIEALKKSKRD